MSPEMDARLRDVEVEQAKNGLVRKAVFAIFFLVAGELAGAVAWVVTLDARISRIEASLGIVKPKVSAEPPAVIERLFEEG